VRVAQVLTASAGGIGRHVASLLPRLVERGHQLEVYCPAATGQTHGFAQPGVPVHPLSKLLHARAADVVHAHGYKAGALAVAACAVGGPPVVVTWHNAILGGARQRLLGRLNQRLVARGAALTLGASSDLVEQARQLGAQQARLGPVAAPVLGTGSGDRDELRAGLGLTAADLLVLTVGRLAPQKNLDLVLDTAAELRDRAGLRFAIVGDGPERDRLAARIDAESLPVELLGSRGDIADLLRAADLALLTSTWEARALVAQEALLAGLPLVSTRVGGIEELVGNAAVLVPPDDAVAAAEAVLGLAEQPQRRTELAAAGRTRAATWPDEDAVADDVAAAYIAVTRSGGGSVRGIAG
jgi:glycosyltransferase involved in cell wall biosynthesis